VGDLPSLNPAALGSPIREERYNLEHILGNHVISHLKLLALSFHTGASESRIGHQREFPTS